MRSELLCHLVDLSSVPSIAMSLPMRYLQAYAAADERLAGRCRLSQHCSYLGAGLDAAWQSIAAALSEPGERRVAAFGGVCWNSPLHLQLAERVRSAFPETLVVFGGNDVAHQASWILGDGRAVDVLVNGEGEAVFSDVLGTFLETGDRTAFHDVKGISFRNDGGAIVTTASRGVVERLDDLPSPFQGDDAADDIARSTALICEFSRGCPFECSFCNWGGAIGTSIRRFTPERIGQDLEFLISHLPDGGLIYIADSNFGMLEADFAAAQILVDTVARLNKRIHIFTNFAKNTNREVVETATLLHRNRLISMVTLSAQTLNPDALVIARRRNMPFDNYVQLQEEFRRRRIPTYTELLIGMPGETYDSFLLGIERVIESGGRPVIYTLLLLNNTHYAKPEVRALHGIRSRLMPFHSLDPSLRADTSVGHDRLSYDEWLTCVGLMVVVPIFYFGLLRFVMRRLRSSCGITYSRMLHRLVRYLMDGEVASHPTVRRLFLNFIDSWREPERFDAGLVSSITGSISGQFGPPHYQAILKVLTTDVPAARMLVAELSGVLADLSEAPVDPGELSGWVAYQCAIAEAMAQASMGRPGEVLTDLEAHDLRTLSGQPLVVEDTDTGRRRLQVRRNFSRYSFDDFLFQMIYGTCETLEMFASAAEACPEHPVRPAVAAVSAVS